MSALANLVDGSFDSIESSDLTRATETASIFAAALGLAVTTTSKLRERSFGEFEGRPIAELPSTLSGIRNGWVVDATARPEGGESLDELLRRVADVVETWRHSPSRRLLVVTHGGTIRAIRAYCSGLEMQGLAWDTVGNCSLWTLDVH
jgi:broad specificity phosphatase PhoE